MNIISEAIVVGISTVVMGTIISKMIQLVKEDKTSNKDWNKYYVMELALFLTGFSIHIIYELIGLNKYYCALKKS